MEFSGVRSSWLMLARNSLLYWLASSSSCALSVSAPWARSSCSALVLQLLGLLLQMGIGLLQFALLVLHLRLRLLQNAALLLQLLVAHAQFFLLGLQLFRLAARFFQQGLKA